MRFSFVPCVVLALALSLPASAAEVKLLSSVPANLASGTASGRSRVAALSADGRWALFSSEAPNLLPGIVDENGVNDVFLHDRVTGKTILVSQSVEDEARTAGNLSTGTAISADGRFVVFVSLASDLVPGQADLGGWDFFLYDRVTGRTELISHKRGARTAATNGSIGGAVISADGRWVAFVSASRELTAQTSTGLENLFLWERRTGEVRLITRSAAVAQFQTIRSSLPALSADGRYVTFYSSAPDLAPGQGETTDSRSVNVFLFDRSTGKTVLVDHAASSPAAGNGAVSPIDQPRITPDGRFVVYASTAKNLVPGMSGPVSASNVFLYERATGKNALVSRAVSSPTIAGDGSSNFGFPSADGGSVLFTSTSANLVAGQTGVSGQPGVFLFSRSTGRITLVSGADGSATATANAGSWSAGLSGDGNTALFESLATDVVPGVTDDNEAFDLFVWDRRTGDASLLSYAAASETTAAPFPGGPPVSLRALLSTDGKWIVFQTLATGLTAGARDANGLLDVVLQGRTGERTLLSRRDPARPSATPGGESRASGVSADGRYVVFTSTAPDLLPGTRDRNRASDVYLADRATGALLLVSRSAAAPGIPASGAASNPRISADGRFVAYVSTAPDVVAGQVDTEEASPDVFLWDRETGATALVSHTPASPSTAGTGANPVVSADGAVVAFESHGDGLVAGQTEGNAIYLSDVFLWERATGTTLLASRALGTAATTGDGESSQPALDASGRFLAFTSGSTDLVAGAVSAYKNVFLFDRLAGTTVLVSHDDDAAGVRGGLLPVLSADGRFIAFLSSSYDLFLWDRTTGVSQFVSRQAGFSATPVDGLVILPGFSADSRYLVFTSTAGDLVPGQQDGSSSRDVFLHDRETGENVLVSRVGSATRTPSLGAFSPVISTDGRFVVFLSRSGDLAGGSGTIPQSVFRFDRQTGIVTLVSRSLAGPDQPANGPCLDPSISANGAVIAFSSFAADLVPSDLNRSTEGPLQDAFAATWP